MKLFGVNSQAGVDSEQEEREKASTSERFHIFVHKSAAFNVLHKSHA